MTNDHSIRSPSTGEKSALRRTLSEPLGLEAMREACAQSIYLEASTIPDEAERRLFDRIAHRIRHTQLPESSAMTESQIKYMVDRFLCWKLPENFNPDGGISFKKTFNDHMTPPMKHEPSGTNLFDATQADAMVRHMLADLPGPSEANSTAAPVGELSGPVQSWGVTVTINGIDALTIESACLSGAPNIDEYREAVENCARHLLAFAGRPDAVPEPVAFMFWNEPDTQRHFSQIRETIGNHWTKIAPLYTRRPSFNDAIEAAAQALREHDMKGRITLPWEKVPKSQRRKWLEKASVALTASLKLPDYRGGEAKTAESGDSPSTREG